MSQNPSQPLPLFEVVRIGVADPDDLPDRESKRRVDCVVGWRSPEAYASPQSASERIDALVARDKQEGRSDPGFYVIVAEGGNPLRDPGCMPLLTHPGTIMVLPF